VLTREEGRLETCPVCCRDLASPSEDRSAGPQRSGRSLRWIVLAVFGLLAAGGLGFYFTPRPNVWIYVDNGGKEDLEVSLDGVQVVTVKAGTCQIVKCREGKKHITVTCGGRTVFEQRKALGSDRPGPAKYVLNPEMTNRYRVRTVNYGFWFPSFKTYYSDLDHYRQIAEQVPVIQPADWFEVHCEYILEKPPASVKGKFQETRYVLCRISKADHDLLSAAKGKQTATYEEIRELEVVVDRILGTKQ
jgi:hypothetical protein